MSKGKIMLCVLGAVLGMASFCLGMFVLTEESVKGVSGVMIGIGSSVFALSLGGLLQAALVPKKVLEEQKRQKDIDVHDERNVRIREKTGAKTNSVIFYLHIAIAIVLSALDVDAWVLIMIAGLLVIQVVLLITLSNYYLKRM